jgi:lipopolysaccharide O-acetyltransferase
MKIDLISFLKRLLPFFTTLRTIHRRALLRLLGLKTGPGCVIWGGVHWPIFNLKQISIGNGVQIGKHSELFIPAHNKLAKIKIGDGSSLGPNNQICALGGVFIGKDCLFSHDIYIADSEHVLGRDVNVIKAGLKYRGNVEIGDRCFIGRNVTILPQVTLGSNCVVGAGAVVTKSFPANCIIGGIPAKLIKML